MPLPPPIPDNVKVPSLLLQVALAGVMFAVIATFVSFITILTAELQRSVEFLRTLIKRSNNGVTPAGTPGTTLPAVNCDQITPSKDHSNKLPVSPGTVNVNEPVAWPKHIGLMILDAIGVPIVPD